MHPIIADQAARLRAADRHAEARQLRGAPRPPTRRAQIGHALLAAGRRLAPEPADVPRHCAPLEPSCC